MSVTVFTFLFSSYSNTLIISPISFLLSCETKGGGYKHEGEGWDKEGGWDKGEGEGGGDECDGKNGTEGGGEYIFYIIFNIYQTQTILLSLVLFFMLFFQRIKGYLIQNIQGTKWLVLLKGSMQIIWIFGFGITM